MDFNATFIIAFVSFIVFIFIMNKILYAPIYDIIQKRKSLIDNEYKTAEVNLNETNKILENKKQILLNASETVREKTLASIEKEKSNNTKTINEAKNQSKSEIEQNSIFIDNELKEAKNELKNEVINLAQMISDRFIQSDNKINQDEELVNLADKII